MRQKGRTLYKGFMLILCMSAIVSGCGKNETAEVREAVFSEAEVEEKQADSEVTEEVEKENPEDEKTHQQEDGGVLYVYVCGQVKYPGVYELKTGDRIVNAITAAGGMTDRAAEMYLNQAEILEDGQKIYVPSKEEAASQSVLVQGKDGHNADEGGQDARSDKVNLNTASEAELMSLSGIGKSRAEAIIAYREKNGGFRSIEEIKKIEGIKDGIFNKIKDKITI